MFLKGLGEDIMIGFHFLKNLDQVFLSPPDTFIILALLILVQ